MLYVAVAVAVEGFFVVVVVDGADFLCIFAVVFVAAGSGAAACFRLRLNVNVPSVTTSEEGGSEGGYCCC